MIFVTYGYYRDTYGGAAAEEDFTPKARDASFWLDSITFGRIDAVNVPSAVQLCTCVLVDCIAEHGAADGIASEHVGNYSVTYADGRGNSLQSRMYDIAQSYLGNTGLLYRGVV